MPEAPVTSATFEWAPFMIGGEPMVSLVRLSTSLLREVLSQQSALRNPIS